MLKLSVGEGVLRSGGAETVNKLREGSAVERWRRCCQKAEKGHCCIVEERLIIGKEEGDV